MTQVNQFLELLPTYQRNAWLFFRSFRDRDELIQNAIGNAWIVYCRTGSALGSGSAVSRP